MATSGSIDYGRTANQIIKLAYKLCGVGSQGETLPAEEQEDGLERLNLMVKSWQAEKVYLWKRKNAILFTTASQRVYSLGGTNNDRAAIVFAETTLSADSAASDTTIDVTSDDDISSADQIGVLLDDGTMHWTTVNGAPAANVVTLTSGLASAASSGNPVFAYTTKMGRPLRIEDAQRVNDAGQATPIEPLSRQEYNDLPNKTASGIPVQYYYDAQLGTSKIYLWTVPSDAKSTIRFTAYMPLEDFDAGTNDPDFPQEWIECLAYNLAVRLFPTYGDSLSHVDREEIKEQALVLKEMLRGWDQETASITFEPYADWQG